MAKKTKPAKKKPAKKASKSRASATRKKKAALSTKKTTSRKRRPAAVVKKRASSATSRKKAASPKKTAAKAAGKKTTVKAGTSVKKSASKKVVAKTPAAPKPAATPVPEYCSSSVIRIKTNAKPKRKGRGKRASSVNHRGETGSAAEATAQDPIQFPEEVRRLPKTHLSAKELREFRTSLSKKRAELCGDVERLTAEAFHQVEEGGSERSAMPIHMADLGTDNWEQDFTLGLIDTERMLVVEIDDALKRIENKTYGVCLGTHNMISLARLRAKPWAKYCIEHARAREEGRAS